MYATLGKTCPYTPALIHFPYRSQHELEIGYRNLISDSTKVNIPTDIYNPPSPKQKVSPTVKNPIEDKDVC